MGRAFPPWRRRAPQPKLGLEVITTNISQNPSCTHGPSICFERFFVGGKSRKFYACSACRDQEGCPFFLWADQCPSKETRKDWQEKIKQSKPSRSHQDEFKRLTGIRSVSSEERGYCTVCSQLCLLPTDPHHTPTEKCNADTVITPIIDQHLQHPSQLVPLKVANKCEAQYLFTEESLSATVSIASQTGAKRMLCVGVPSVHEALSMSRPSDTMLLDIDARYRGFFSPKSFVRFNMFNHHFFDGASARKRLIAFLAGQKDVCILCDPPFGARAELLAVTFDFLTDLWREANSITDTAATLPVLLMFPYFLENQVSLSLPNFTMLDYKINYSNHETYTSGTKKAMKRGSAVRIFTNKFANAFTLPENEGYKRCEPCDRWVHKDNVHCDKCAGCMGKDGSGYVHCDTCDKCVKPSWKHCSRCNKCQTQDHKCSALPPMNYAEAQKNEIAQTCHACGKTGHKRTSCPVRKIKSEKNSERKRKNKGPSVGGKESTQYLNVIDQI